MNKKGKLSSNQTLHHVRVFHNIPNNPFLFLFKQKYCFSMIKIHAIMLVHFKSFSGSLSLNPLKTLIRK